MVNYYSSITHLFVSFICYPLLIIEHIFSSFTVMVADVYVLITSMFNTRSTLSTF